MAKTRAKAPPPDDGDALKLFFALWPDLETRNALAAWQRDLQKGRNARAMRPWTLHLTLVFLGVTPDDRLDAVKDAAAGVRGRAFDFALDTAGYWPHNHIVWAGCGSPPPPMLEFQATLADRLKAAGFTLDARPFHPHVTLLRNVRDAKGELPQAIVPWSAREFVLVESQPMEDGSRYQTIAKFPLRQ